MTIDQWKGNAIARFFLWCSGARIYLLKKCPTEINIFMGIGIVVFLTGMMAAISGGYAFYMVFQSIGLATIFGLFWGILIFFMDWYLVSSLKKEKKKGQEFAMAFPRILLAVFIAIVVARPIEMKLFEKEIDLQVQKSQLAEREKQKKEIVSQFNEIKSLKKENDSLQAYLQRKATRRNTRYKEMIAEAEGRSPVGVVGKGPVYKEKQEEYQLAKQELKAERTRVLPIIEANRERIAQLNRQKDELTATNQVIIARANGFLSRLSALHQLQQNKTMVRWASLFILLLFIAIETSPVFVKLISARGPYDELLEAEQLRHSYAAKQQTERYKHEQQLAGKDLAQKNKLLSAQNDQVMSDAYQSITNAKLEVNKERIKKWKELQMKKNGATVNKDFPKLLDMNNRPQMNEEDKTTPPSS